MPQAPTKKAPRQKIVTMTPPDRQIEYLHEQSWHITRVTVINDKGREIQFEIQRTPSGMLGIFANDANAGQDLIDGFRAKRKEIVRAGANDNEMPPADVAEAAKYFPAKTELKQIPLVPQDHDLIWPFQVRAAHAAGVRDMAIELQHIDGEKLKVVLIFHKAAEACAWFTPTRDVPKAKALLMGYGMG